MECDIGWMAEQLYDAADAEGTEVGEYWCDLYNVWHSSRSQGGSTFMVALEQEIEAQHEWFVKNFEWVDCTQPPCSHCGRGGTKYKELVWKGYGGDR